MSLVLSSPWMLVGLVAGGLAVAGGLVWWMVRMRRPDLECEVDTKVVKRGWWLWRSVDVYRRTQLKYKGIPVGQPTETLVYSDKEINEEALAQVAETAAQVASAEAERALPAASSKKSRRS